jgi:hypothetical protein
VANVPPPASTALRHEPRAFADLRQEDIVDLSSQLASCFGVIEFAFADADIHHLLFPEGPSIGRKRIRREQHLKGPLEYSLRADSTTPVHWLEKAAEVPLI